MPNASRSWATAQEGCDRCECGSKYWENDRCVDCGAEHHPEKYCFIFHSRTSRTPKIHKANDEGLPKCSVTVDRNALETLHDLSGQLALGWPRCRRCFKKYFRETYGYVPD